MLESLGPLRQCSLCIGFHATHNGLGELWSEALAGLIKQIARFAFECLYIGESGTDNTHNVMTRQTLGVGYE